jgi:hypothetical protein
MFSHYGRAKNKKINTLGYFIISVGFVVIVSAVVIFYFALQIKD